MSLYCNQLAIGDPNAETNTCSCSLRLTVAFGNIHYSTVLSGNFIQHACITFSIMLAFLISKFTNRYSTQEGTWELQ